ncbi:hypothetical protein QQX98_010924 [Neonectria punicea]|uniref:Heat shock factor binding protein 1 n=1 Tax=Neonectria punicea TaxID=979145 RepID=A0ABR1GN53_9HYPO
MATNNPEPASLNTDGVRISNRYNSGRIPEACSLSRRSQLPPDETRADVTAAVEDLLNSLSNKFAGVSSEIFAKMDEMSRRLDNLEASLQENKAKDGGSSQ